jgi:hypothetical protein
MRSIALLFVGCLLVNGCSKEASLPHDPNRRITAAERARMPPHERDDPYTLQHLEPVQRSRR